MGNVTPNLQRLPGFTGDWQTDAPTMQALMARFMSDTTNTAQGNLRVVNNMGGEYKTLTLKAPASDWTTLALGTGITSTTAAANGFAGPRFRYVYGGLLLDGGCESGAGTIAALPYTIATGLPGGVIGFNEDYVGWIEITAPGAWAQTCLLRVDNTGALTLRSASTGQPAFNWTVGFLNITGIIPTTTLQPPPLSCFPFKYKTGLASVSSVMVAKAINTTASNASVSLGTPAWGFDGAYITINNIPGLELGQTYSVTLEGLP